MDKQIDDLLYGIPKNVDYTEFSDELDSEDILDDRIKKVEQLLDSSDDYVAFQAARILTSWGKLAGFNKLTSLMDNNKISGFIDHRLYGYDDTLSHVLWSFRRYFSQRYDNNEWDTETKNKMFPYVEKIIKIANIEPFQINALFGAVEDNDLSEYIPLLKEHLISIIDHPEIHGWKIHDVIELFLKVDPDFVYKLLDEKGKTLKDFNFDE